MRAVVVYSNSFLRGGGAFYRITAYDDFLIIVMWSSFSIRYDDIHLITTFDESKPSSYLDIKMKDSKITIRIHSTFEKISELYRLISNSPRSLS